MSKLATVARSVAAVWGWLGGPWRSLQAFCIALVNMDRRQMRALFSIAMLGGIISLSFQNTGLILMVQSMLGDALPGSLFGKMALNQQFWNNIIIMVFSVSLSLIVWGADYFTAKYKGGEFEAGRRDAKLEGAKRVEQAATEERKDIEAETSPTKPNDSPPSPDDDFEKNTR